MSRRPRPNDPHAMSAVSDISATPGDPPALVDGRSRGSQSDRWTRPLLGLAAGLLVAGAVVAPFDLTVAAWFRTSRLPGDLGKAVMLSEVFAHGVGAGVILLTVWLLDERLHGGQGRRRLAGVVLGAFGGGLVTDLIKVMVDRVRPRALDFSAVQTALGTFATPEGIGGADLHSFPSGHSAVAAGLGCTLAMLHPQARWLFAGVWVAACFQRIAASAHYPSDVACGAALGVAVAAACAGMVSPRAAGPQAIAPRSESA